MNLTIDNITATGGNNVLIEPFPNDYITIGGKELVLIPVNENTSVAVTGKVVKCPKVLDFSYLDYDFETTMEVIPGDEVIFSYVSARAAYECGLTFNIDGKFYFLITYYHLYAAKRMKGVLHYDIIPLNGQLICTSVEEKNPLELPYDLPDDIRSRQSVKLAKVLVTGSCNKNYKLFPNHKDDEDIRVGDIVIVDAYGLLKAEYWDRFFGKEQDIYRVSRLDVIGKIRLK